MSLPSVDNPRKYTLTTKVPKDVYLEVLNEAERQDRPVSQVAYQYLQRGRVSQK